VSRSRNITVTSRVQHLNSIMSKPSLTISILESYYPLVQGLCEYLSDILEPEANGEMGFKPSEMDSTEYRTLIQTSFVALDSLADQPSKRIKVFDPMMDMREVRFRADTHVKDFSSKHHRYWIEHKRDYSQNERVASRPTLFCLDTGWYAMNLRGNEVQNGHAQSSVYLGFWE
jgi:hypothetical protein